MSSNLDTYLNKINSFFKDKNNSKYIAHKKAQDILLRMSSDQQILFEIIRRNLNDPEFLMKTRHYPTLAMLIFEDNNFSFYLNIFPPHPSRRTDISSQSIHHHGKLILSTVSAFGPGYNSILFKKGFSIDFESCLTKMEIEKDYQNQLNEVSFVDESQPHIVFYPIDFSGTYALWSDFENSTKDVVKRIGVINKFKKPIAKVINYLGLARTFGLNKIEFFDFYVENEKIKAMKERERYMADGGNENFLQNIFCFIQKTGFNDVEFLERLYNKESTPSPAKKYIKMLLAQEEIQDVFFDGHLNIEKVNLLKNDILKAVQ